MTNKKVLLSVVTVVFNGEKHIKSAIDSVVTQKSELVEYIIIDGASTDATLDIIKAYGDSITRVNSEPDLGIYDAINKGVALASGQYIAFLNSDDYYVDGVLALVLRQLLLSAPDVLYADMDIIDDKSSIKRCWRPGRFNKSKLKKLWIPPHPTTVVKKEMMDHVGNFRLHYKLAADYDLLLKILLTAKHVVYLDTVMTRMRLGGVTNKSWVNIFNQNIEIFNSFKHHFGRYPTYQFVYKIYGKILQFMQAKRLVKR